MTTKIEKFLGPFLKKGLLDIRPGDTIKVYQKIKETLKKDKTSTGKEDKEKIQVFEGIVLARKHGKEIGATITVRKIISGVGVERIFPLHSPTIEKIEVLRRGRVRRAKLYYLRKVRGKKARLKRKEFVRVATKKKPLEEGEIKKE
ncbi:50S ribosomal protein L19 [Patescibacteria group bacterium]|nr:50S ribosomal protein L19 [Patescibacteria group bacterium]